MNESPKISVVVPTRNRVRHLQRMIESVLRSDYRNFEIIVADGASTDGTVNLLKSYSSGLCRWISEPDEGEYFALNKAVAMASGEIIKTMPDDDALRPTALSLAAARFKENPALDVLFGRAAFWREVPDGREFVGETPPVDVAKLKLSNMFRGRALFHSPASFIHRRVFDRLGLFSTEYACGDDEFWMRAMANHAVFDAVPNVIYDSYRHENCGMETKKWQLKADAIRLCRKYGSPADLAHAIYHYYCRSCCDRWLSEFCRSVGFHPRRWVRRLCRS